VVRLYNGSEPMPDETVYVYTSFGEAQNVITDVNGEATATFTAPPFAEYVRIYGKCGYGEDSYHVHIIPARLDVDALSVEGTALTNIDVKFYNADYTALLPDRPATVCMYRESGWRSTNDVFSEYVCPPIGEYDKNVVVPEYGSYRVEAGWRYWQSSDYVFMSPWSVTVSAESSYPANTTALIPVSVTDKMGAPVANATVMGVERVWIDGTYFNGIITARTDASGQALLEVPIPPVTSWTNGYMDIGVATNTSIYGVDSVWFSVMPELVDTTPPVVKDLTVTPSTDISVNNPATINATIIEENLEEVTLMLAEQTEVTEQNKTYEFRMARGVPPSEWSYVGYNTYNISIEWNATGFYATDGVNETYPFIMEMIPPEFNRTIYLPVAFGPEAPPEEGIGGLFLHNGTWQYAMMAYFPDTVKVELVAIGPDAVFLNTTDPNLIDMFPNATPLDPDAKFRFLWTEIILKTEPTPGEPPSLALANGTKEFTIGDLKIQKGVALSSGEYLVIISARDQAGNEGGDATFITVGEPSENILTTPDLTVLQGNNITTSIMLKNSTGVGCIGVKLSYNASVVNVTDATMGNFTAQFGFDNTNAANGWITINTYITGQDLTGDVKVADVTLDAVGNLGDSSPLNLEIFAMADQYGSNVNGTTDTGTFTIPLDIGPPIVTNPSSSQLIPDDTDNDPRWGETATLKVTVTDDSSVASVTINLSAIGGSPIQPMTNISDNIWSFTTNASAGTPPQTYYIQVNATDIYSKSNTSVSIPLIVMRNGDTTGDNVVNIADAMLLANNVSYPYHVPPYAISSSFVADVTGDGVVNIADAMLIANNVSYPYHDPPYLLR